jgi:hypothetical protein
MAMAPRRRVSLTGSAVVACLLGVPEALAKFAKACGLD